ncbi:MAG TPA: hypothetical protein VGF28_12360 [Thermoanaerobaculia bacterium]|jgi:hypothetical protein
MTKAILLVLLSALALAAGAQETRNAAYFELGGSAIIPSVNYERRFSPEWFGRIGASVVTGSSETTDDTDTTIIVPVTASYVTRPASNHHLELGGGITVAGGDRQELYDFGDDDDETFSTAFVTGIVGYRYQKPDGGFQFRAVFTPVAGGGDFLPWAGLSFGYAW